MSNSMNYIQNYLLTKSDARVLTKSNEYLLVKIKEERKMAQFDITNFLIDHVVRGLMVSPTDGSVLWMLNQITNPALSVTSETADVVDALGATIAQFYRSKTAQFTGENALFDLNLLAAQGGSTKKIAASGNTVITPAFETVTVNAGGAVTLKHEPIGQIQKIYALTGSSALGTVYTNGDSASATEFVHEADSTSLTPPSDFNGQLFIQYEYEAENAIEVVNTAVDFPKAGKFILEVLGCDVCDQETLIHAYVVFPVAKLSPDTDLNFTSDGTHSFTINAFQEYCDNEKQLFKIVVPDEE